MLRLFTSNQPLSNILLPFIGALFIVPELFDLEPDSAQHGFISLRAVYSVTWIGLIIHLGLVSLGGILCSRLFNRHDFHQQVNFLPGLLFVLLAECFLSGTLGIEVLTATVFLLLGINNLLKIFRQNRVLDECFRSGLWFGVAALLWSPLLVLVIFLLVALAFVRAFNWREHMIAFIGFLVPFVYLLSMVFLIDKLSLFSPPPLSDSLEFWIDWSSYLGSSEFILGAVLILISIVGFRLYLSSYRQSSNKARNSKSVFLILGTGAALAAILNPSVPTITVAAPFGAFVMAFVFLDIRRKIIARVAFYVLVLICITYQAIQLEGIWS
jgi:hypothetical protein